MELSLDFSTHRELRADNDETLMSSFSWRPIGITLVPLSSIFAFFEERERRGSVDLPHPGACARRLLIHTLERYAVQGGGDLESRYQMSL